MTRDDNHMCHDEIISCLVTYDDNRMCHDVMIMMDSMPLVRCQSLHAEVERAPAMTVATISRGYGVQTAGGGFDWCHVLHAASELSG